MKYYRLSVDDNIFVFRDLSNNLPKSIFDHEYLAMWRYLHKQYNTKIQLNIYEQTEGFLLSQMPDIWKREWEENSSWLKLSFHAKADLPKNPYRNSTYNEVYQDCNAVQKEILRFAGPKTLSSFTTIHYTTTTAEGREALRNCGIQGLVGLFGTPEKPQISYGLPIQLCKEIRKSDGYYDPNTKLWYFCNDVVINNFSISELLPQMQLLTKQKFIEIMIHEQYFYKDYCNYHSDYQQKIECVLTWLSEKNYQSCFLEEMIETN